jgi:hypothetical protein
MDFESFAREMLQNRQVCTFRAQNIHRFLVLQESLKTCKFGQIPQTYSFRIQLPTNSRGILGVSCSVVPHIEAHLVEKFGPIDCLEIMTFDSNAKPMKGFGDSEVLKVSNDQDMLLELQKLLS